MSAIVIKEGLIHYEAIGRGKPLVFIHGWLGSWRYWVPAMEVLSSRYRTYAFDLWGFGDSDKLETYYNVDAYADLIVDFLDQLGIWRVPLVGHALGGLAALSLADRLPDRVEKVMGVSVPLVGSAIDRPLAGFSGNGDALQRLVARRADHPEVSMEVRKTDWEAVVKSTRSAESVDLRDLLPYVEAPVLLVYGGSDSLIKPPQPGWLEECEENVRSIFLGNANHFPMLEERNKFNRLLLDFLEAGDDLASLKLKDEWQRRLR